MHRLKLSGISLINWFLICSLAVSGGLAWSMENNWFNTFVYEEITPKPEPVTYMVVASAIVGTITTLAIGTWSDKLGTRRSFISIGYMLWGLSTIVFPLSAYARSARLGIILVVLLDCTMSFFGTASNASAFQAWVTDISDETNRGRLESILGIMGMAVGASDVVSGIVIDRLGYQFLFSGVGILVFCSGLIAYFLLNDDPDLRKNEKDTGIHFFKQLLSVFSPRSVRQNQYFFILMILMVLYTIGAQIYLPYQMIYINHNLGFSKTTMSYVQLGLMAFAPLFILLVILIGRAVDRGKSIALLVAGLAVNLIGLVSFSLSKELWSLVGSYFLIGIGSLPLGITVMSWSRNLMPEDQIGQFVGVRMIFYVMLPMMIGPIISNIFINRYGISAQINGVTGIIPPAVIFVIAAVFYLLAFIPLYFLRDADGPGASDPGSGRMEIEV